MTIDELLCKFQGKCWHEWEWNIPEEGIPPYVCLLCGYRAKDASRLDYADDHTAMELLRWFFKEKEGMFMEFYDYMDIVAEDFLLLKKVDGKQYMSWVVLLAEWLRLEETREKWGWEECHGCDGRDSVPVECSEGNKECGGAGKLPAPWLEERRPNETDSFQTDRRGEKEGLGYAPHPHAFGHKDYSRAKCRYCDARFRISEE